MLITVLILQVLFNVPVHVNVVNDNGLWCNEFRICIQMLSNVKADFWQIRNPLKSQTKWQRLQILMC